MSYQTYLNLEHLYKYIKGIIEMSPAYKKLTESITPDELQLMLDSMSLYKIYTKLKISDKLLLKYIANNNLKFKNAYRTIYNISEYEQQRIIFDWTTTNISKRELFSKFQIGTNTLNKILKNNGILDRKSKQVDKEWLDYHKLVLKLTNVIVRHYKLKSPDKNFDLDHKVSIRDGYLQKIPAALIASIENLEFIPASINRSNGDKSSISKEELYKLCKV